MPKNETPKNTKKIEAYAAKFNTPDEYGDRIMPGAFTKSLADIEALPITMRGEVVGEWLEFGQDGKGLKVKGYLFDGVDVGSLPRSVSMGFIAPNGAVDVKMSDQGLTRTYKQLNLTEIELVSSMVLPGAEVTLVEGEGSWLSRMIDRIKGLF